MASRPRLRCLYQRSGTLSSSSSCHASRRTFTVTAVCRQEEPEAQLTALNGCSWQQPTGLFINNKFRESSNKQTLKTIDPFTECDTCSVSSATEEDISSAVSAARVAFQPSWSEDAPFRSHVLHKLADLIDDNRLLLSTIETLDNGKPFAVTREVDLPDVSATFRYYAGWADKIHGHMIPCGPSPKMAYTIREPIGVCAQIIPWNYPLLMAAWKVAPALAAGNTVVLKLAEQTPLSMLYMGRLIRAAGFPRGVVNIVSGTGKEAGAALAAHPDVDKVAFTGSTATGREVMRLAAGTLKDITLETGGKSPLLVFPDANLDKAARWAHEGIMSNQGQVCTATSRLLVHEDVHDDFVARLIKVTKKVSVMGSPWDEGTFQGPQISRAQQETVLGHIQVARGEGATIALGGEEGTPDFLSEDVEEVLGSDMDAGFFVQPTIITDVRPSMRAYREEIFGPCVVVTKFGNEAEAVKMANDTPYGLGAAIFTRDVARAHRVARRIDAGMVWVNSSNDSDYRVPFGGVKQSGMGRELGEAGLKAYTREKAVHINLSED